MACGSLIIWQVNDRDLSAEKIRCGAIDDVRSLGVGLHDLECVQFALSGSTPIAAWSQTGVFHAVGAESNLQMHLSKILVVGQFEFSRGLMQMNANLKKKHQNKQALETSSRNEFNSTIPSSSFGTQWSVDLLINTSNSKRIRAPAFDGALNLDGLVELAGKNGAYQFFQFGIVRKSESDHLSRCQ